MSEADQLNVAAAYNRLQGGAASVDRDIETSIDAELTTPQATDMIINIQRAKVVSKK